jgi:hypothetical protein
MALHGFDGEKKTCQEIAGSEGIPVDEVEEIAEDAMSRMRQLMV